MNWWWVSVAGLHTGKFKGVVIAQGDDLPELSTKAQTLYVEGGGDRSECLDVRAYGPLHEEDVPAPEWRERLVTSKADVELHLNGESAASKSKRRDS